MLAEESHDCIHTVRLREQLTIDRRWRILPFPESQKSRLSRGGRQSPSTKRGSFRSREALVVEWVPRRRESTRLDPNDITTVQAATNLKSSSSIR